MNYIEFAQNLKKFFAILNRKRNKGRDFFDVVYLLGQGVIPNFEYLRLKTGVNNPEMLKERILAKCKALNMQAMANDVSPFLFNKNEEKAVLLFPKYIGKATLG